MAGAMGHYVYTADDGTAYQVRAPVWVAGIQTATAAGTQPRLPTGVKPRRRFLRNTSSGKEHAVTVFSASDTLYSEEAGVAVSIPTLGSATATALVTAGRTGEKMKAI